MMLNKRHQTTPNAIFAKPLQFGIVWKDGVSINKWVIKVFKYEVRERD